VLPLSVPARDREKAMRSSVCPDWDGDAGLRVCCISIFVAVVVVLRILDIYLAEVGTIILIGDVCGRHFFHKIYILSIEAVLLLELNLQLHSLQYLSYSILEVPRYSIYHYSAPNSRHRIVEIKISKHLREKKKRYLRPGGQCDLLHRVIKSGPLPVTPATQRYTKIQILP
jgi:hypothetical protein